MANNLKSVEGRATIAGTVLYTAGTGETLTLVGIRCANNDNTSDHTFHVDKNGFIINGIETPLPIGSALEACAPSKIVINEGDVITAYSDTDNNVDIILSFLEQTPE